MRGACKEFIEDLALYAEGELDPRRATEVELHLRFCEDCHAWVAGYDDLTREILEADRAGGPGGAGLEEDSGPDGTDGEPAWSPRPLSAARSPDPLERAFADRVMRDVGRIALRARFARAGRIAAAVIVIAGLVAGGGAWISGRLREAPAPDLAGPADLDRPAVADAVPARAPATARGDLASAWWVLDPDREGEAAAGREVEASIYSILAAEREARDLDRDLLVLKALLGARIGRSAAGDRSGFIMVPEGGGSDIPLRPVALPVRVPEREIAAPMMARLQAPARRYRIICLGGGPSIPLAPPLEDRRFPIESGGRRRAPEYAPPTALRLEE